MEGLGEVFAGDFVCAREVGDGSADLEDAVAGLSHGGVRQADDHREGFTLTVVHLHLHGMGDDPLEG